MKYVCIQSLHACGGSLSGVRSDGFLSPSLDIRFRVVSIMKAEVVLQDFYTSFF
jgi:hypothetical protein